MSNYYSEEEIYHLLSLDVSTVTSDVEAQRVYERMRFYFRFVREKLKYIEDNSSNTSVQNSELEKLRKENAQLMKRITALESVTIQKDEGFLKKLFKKK